MVYIKTAIVMVVISLGIIIALMFATFDADYELQVALDAFLKEESTKADACLNKLEGAIPEPNLHLYRAYISRLKNDIKASQINLTEAMSSLRDESSDSIKLEVLLNRCLNAYLLQDYSLLAKSLVEATTAFPDDLYVHFFQGIYSYYADCDLKAALQHFESSATKEAPSPWMKKAFGGVFTPVWEKLRLTACHIQQGDYLQARQILEQHGSLGSTEELADVNLLIGITYLKEALEKPLKAQAPYYKLAFSYIDNVPILNKRYDTERRQIIDQLVSVTTELVNTGAYRDIPTYAVWLENLHALDELNQLRSLLVSQLDSQIVSKEWPSVHNLSALLNRLVIDETGRQQLSDRFENLLTALIDQKKTDLLNYYWEVLRLFSKNLEELGHKISFMTTTKVLEVIPSDDTLLSLSTAYLAFLKNIEQRPDVYTKLANDFLTLSDSLWTQSSQESKALNLMKKALSIVPEEQKEPLHDSIEKVIASVHEKALTEGLVEKLPFVLEAVKELKLTHINIQNPSQERQFLVQARALFDSGDYDNAEKRANWILSLDPQNGEASFVVGMIAYSRGRYQDALTALGRLQAAPKAAEEALAVCQYLIGDKDWGLKKIQLLALENSLTGQAYLRIGIFLLATNDPQSAISWFEKITPAGDEVLAALAFASYTLKEWETSQSYLDRLSESFKNIAELQALSAQCLYNAGKVEEAKSKLATALESSESSDASTFSAPFLLFKDNMLSEMKPRLLAARLSIGTDKGIQKALEDLETLSPRAEETEIQPAVDKESYKDLLTLLASAKDPTARQATLPLVAMASQKMGYNTEAAIHFEEYFSFQNSSVQYRGNWAGVLMALRQYERALQQFLLLRNSTPLPQEFLVPYLECLIRTGHSEEAVEQADLWIRNGTVSSLNDQLSLLHEMIIPKANGLIYNTLRKFPKADELNISDKISLSGLLFKMGRVSKAYDIMRPIEVESKETALGREVLINLYQGLSRHPEALALAKESFKLSPYDADLMRFVYRYETDAALQKELLDELRALRKTGNLSVSDKIFYARKLTNLTRAAADSSSTSYDDFFVELREAYFILEQVARTQTQTPEIFFLMGETELLANHPDKALPLYEHAVKLDPSYSDAYRSLAHLHRANGNLLLARDYLITATKFDPFNATAWMELAALQIDRRDYFEAKLALFNTIRFRPNASGAYVSLARVLLELKNPEDAKAILEQAVKISPQNIDALKLLLACLYDRSMGKKLIPSSTALRRAKASVYGKIYAIDPSQAEETFKSLNESALTPQSAQELEQQLVK